MGASWIFSFSAFQIPKDRFEEVNKIVSEILLPGSDFYSSVENDFGEIEIWNCEIYSSFSFDRWAIRELKKRIWSKGFLEFSFGVEVVEGVSTIEFGEEEFKKFKNEKASNFNDYVDDYKHYLECEDDMARAFDLLNGL